MAWHSLKSCISKAISSLRRWKSSRKGSSAAGPAKSSASTSTVLNNPSSRVDAVEFGGAGGDTGQLSATEDRGPAEAKEQDSYDAASSSERGSFGAFYAHEQSDECTEIEANSPIEEPLRLPPDIVVVQPPDSSARDKVSSWLETSH